ncbi:hypothetical protein GIB67_024851, partial [Kingdonia uniflora]
MPRGSEVRITIARGLENCVGTLMAEIETRGRICDVHFKRAVQKCAGVNSPWGGLKTAVGWIEVDWIHLEIHPIYPLD